MHLNGHPTDRLPNTLNVSLDRARTLTVLDRLDTVAASAGSACHSGQDKPSPALTAMGVPYERAVAALRFSLGRWTTNDEVDQAAEHIATVANAAN